MSSNPAMPFPRSKGIVTQITNATTAVTLNTQCGQITTFAETAAAGATVAFTFNNSFIAGTTSLVLITQAGGTNTIYYEVKAVVTGAGAATITIMNVDLLNALNGTIILNFLVIP